MSRQLCKLHPQWDYQREHGCPDCLRELRTANADLTERLAETEKAMNGFCAAYGEAKARLAAAEEREKKVVEYLDIRCSGCEIWEDNKKHIAAALAGIPVRGESENKGIAEEDKQ